MDPLTASRRAVLGAGALLAAGPATAAGPNAEAEARRILERYHAFGDKASGGPGDEASGAWLEGELKALGYAVKRQPFEAPAYEGEATLSTGGASAAVIPQAIVTPTLAGGITGPLHGGDRDGGIALVVLPYARWSTALAIEQRLKTVKGDAVVLVTTGPTSEAVALNAPADRKLFDRPVAVLAPKEAAPFVAAAAKGETATLNMSGRSAGLQRDRHSGPGGGPLAGVVDAAVGLVRMCRRAGLGPGGLADADRLGGEDEAARQHRPRGHQRA